MRWRLPWLVSRESWRCPRSARYTKVRSARSWLSARSILPGKDGLLHISEIANRRFETMEQTGLKEGDMIEVKLIGLDPKNGKLKLSRKALLNGKKE